MKAGRRFGWVFGWALAVLALGHAVAAIAPRQILRWDSQPLRLYLLEGTLFIAGVVALVGMVGGARRLVVAQRARSWRVEIADAVFTSSLALSVFMGLVTAVRYRWVSQWSLATVVPYIHSLGQGQPNAGLVSAMPVAVQLHMVAGLAALATLPFSSVGAVVASAVARVIRAAMRGSDRLGAALARSLPRVAWRGWLWPEEDVLDAARARRRQAMTGRGRPSALRGNANGPARSADGAAAAAAAAGDGEPGNVSNRTDA